MSRALTATFLWSTVLSLLQECTTEVIRLVKMQGRLYVSVSVCDK